MGLVHFEWGLQLSLVHFFSLFLKLLKLLNLLYFPAIIFLLVNNQLQLLLFLVQKVLLFLHYPLHWVGFTLRVLHFSLQPNHLLIVNTLHMTDQKVEKIVNLLRKLLYEICKLPWAFAFLKIRLYFPSKLLKLLPHKVVILLNGLQSCQLSKVVLFKELVHLSCT